MSHDMSLIKGGRGKNEKGRKPYSPERASDFLQRSGSSTQQKK